MARIRLNALVYDSNSFKKVVDRKEYIPSKEWEDLLKKVDYPDENELKRISKEGLLLGYDNLAGDYVIMPWKTLTRHIATFGVSGSGKTFLLLSLLTNWTLERIFGDAKAGAVVIDNIGNFKRLGVEFFEDFYLKHYKHLGTLEELKEKIKNEVVHYAVNPLEHQKDHFLVLDFKDSLEFLEFLENIGIRTQPVQYNIFKLLKPYLNHKGYLVEGFSFDVFLEDLQREIETIFEEQKFSASNLALIQVLAGINKFLDEFGKVFRKEKVPKKIIVSDASRAEERWIFHYSLSQVIYKQVKRRGAKSELNYLLIVDEYNDILDDVELIKSSNMQKRREGHYAEMLRNFILKLWREGRNYGYSSYIATQSPFQLLVKEGRRMGNIATKFWGYLGNEVDKMAKLKKVEITKHLDILQQESSNGWISRPREGKFLIESDDESIDATQLQIFPPLFIQY